MNNNIIVKSSFIKSPHGFSTRVGGVSKGIFNSLNLGMNRGDDIDSVKENWKRFLKASGIDATEFVCGKQVHGNYVHIVEPRDLRPAYGKGHMNEADGYVTNMKNVPLAVFTADCVPVLMEDTDNGVIACIHSGWRSTVADIEGEAVKKMLALGAKKECIRVAIGPAICEKCFEVGQEVIDAVNDLLYDDDDELYLLKSPEPGPNAKYLLNLRGVVKRRLEQLGIISSNIDIISDCTMCMPEKYWSHRYTNGERGSQANIITLI